MKKHLSLLMLAAVVATPAIGATNLGTRAGSSADLTGGPAVRERVPVDYAKYETTTTTRTYSADEAPNMYYTSPSGRSALYKSYSNGRDATTTTVRKTRSETLRSELKRKYYLAHPFYQPTQGKIGSITDLSYNSVSYDFEQDTFAPIFENGEGAMLPGGSWKATGFSIKEDLSYGITDRIAIMGMLRFDMNDYKYKWSDGSPDDSMSDNGLTLWGLGAQWRFVDDADWIATVSGYFQHEDDFANYYVLDLKGGYKVARSTIYGLLRGWYVDFEGDSYGNAVTDGAETMYLAYKSDTSSALYIEGGIGVFSVLDEDWTLNLEAVFGNYDWHNQLSVKGAIGWQPNDWFALNLYARYVPYDSADGKSVDMYWAGVNEAEGVNLPQLTNIGTASLDGYSEYSLGLQVIFQF